ncbi:MAG: hypothetical protein WBL79_06785 [Bacillota bacterium]
MMAITDKGALCVVNIEPLQKSYSNEREVTHVLRDITLYVCAGERLSVMGPLGSGMRLPAGFSAPRLGWMRFNYESFWGVRLGRRCFFCCLFFQ